MNKIICISTNDNKSYFSYLPYVQKSWNILGWNTITFYLGHKDIKSTDQNLIVKIDPVTGFRDETVVQVSRFFAHKYVDGIIMTSDVDMLPLSDYWHPHPKKFTCYGKDLTFGKHYPLCYIAAPKKLWSEVITENSIEELLQKHIQSKSSIFEEWWFTDQDIITTRLRNLDIVEVDRGFENSWASGRIDRDFWFQTRRLSKSQKIDAHMPRLFDKTETINLIKEYLE